MFRTLFFVLLLSLGFGCSDGDGGNGESGNRIVYETKLDGTTVYLVKENNHFLMYRSQTHFDCYVYFRFNIVLQEGNAYYIENDNGELVEFTHSHSVITANFNGAILEFNNNGQTEADITPMCGNSQAQGEVSVAITFQQLPDSIVSSAENLYEWTVIFDMDNDMQISTGDVKFTVLDLFGRNNPSVQQTPIEEIGAKLYVYYANNSSTSVGDISLVVEGNTMTISAPKSIYTSLESITLQTQINVSAVFSDSLAYHSDYLPGPELFTAVMDTSSITDDMNDQFETASFVDIVNASVSID